MMRTPLPGSIAAVPRTPLPGSLVAAPPGPPPLPPGESATGTPAAGLPAGRGHPPAQPGYQVLSPPPPGRLVLQVPFSLASTLVLVWVLSVALAYVLGSRIGAAGHVPQEKPGTPVSAPQEGTEKEVLAPAPGQRLGDSIYVMKRISSWTAKDRVDLLKEADRLNDLMRRKEYADKGWKPFFGVREPQNGTLELVFGRANNTWGVDRRQFEDFIRVLAAPASKGGGGWSGAWQSVVE